MLEVVYIYHVGNVVFGKTNHSWHSIW